jgi:hypothetical protein
VKIVAVLVLFGIVCINSALHATTQASEAVAWTVAVLVLGAAALRLMVRP